VGLIKLKKDLKTKGVRTPEGRDKDESTVLEMRGKGRRREGALEHTGGPVGEGVCS